MGLKKAKSNFCVCKIVNCKVLNFQEKNMATSTIDANPGDNSILEDDNDPDLSLETGDDPELEAIKAWVRQMEEEAAKLKQMQSEVDKQMTSPAGSAAGVLNMSYEEKVEVDARSVYCGNVDYGATAEELEQHFHEGDKLKYYRNGQTNRASPQATGHPEDVGVDSAELDEDIEVVVVLEQ